MVIRTTHQYFIAMNGEKVSNSSNKKSKNINKTVVRISRGYGLLHKVNLLLSACLFTV